MNLQIFSFYITLRMQTSKQTSLFKKSVSKYPGIWGTLLQILSSGALCNISFHCAHDKMTLREKWKSVQEEGLKSYDRQKKIGNRINFYMFRTLDDFNDQLFHATGIGAILIFEGQISSKRIQPTGLWTIHFIEALLAERKSVSFKICQFANIYC